MPAAVRTELLVDAVVAGEEAGYVVRVRVDLAVDGRVERRRQQRLAGRHDLPLLQQPPLRLEVPATTRQPQMQ